MAELAGVPTKGRSNVTGTLLLAIFASAFGSAFQHGYNTGVINAPEKVIEEWITEVQTNRTGEVPSVETVKMIWSVTVSVFCVGGMLGGCVVGIVADRLGRKISLLLNNILVGIAALFMGVSRAVGSYELLTFGRFIIGINSGLNAGLAPLYLAEISPVGLRGAVGTVYQLVITISICVSQVLGLEGVLGNEKWWPVLLGITAIPAVIQVVLLLLCPESPKHVLLSTGNELRAKQVLTWLRGDLDVHDELEGIKGEGGSSNSLLQLILKPSLRMPLLISVVLMMAQQFSGINAAMYYSTTIFNDAGLSMDAAQLATLAMGAVNVAMTVISLVLVEKAGRKTLLLAGFCGTLVSTLLLVFCLKNNGSAFISYLSVAAVILFVIAFATGPGSIPWFMVTELFAQPSRPVATSVGVTVNWASNFVVALGFLPLQFLIQSNVFLIFGFLQLLSILFIFAKVPETKNKTTEEITAMFER